MSPLYLLLFLLFAGTHNAEKISDDILIQQVTVDDNNYNNKVIVGSHQHFTLFKEKYGKTYGTKEEDDYRFKIFKSNIARAKINQALDPTAVHGVNQFSDMTPHEFRTRFLGVRSKLQYPAHANIAPFLPTDNLPSTFDWRLLGGVTPVKNQGSCGSCWSFSTTGALEGAHFISTGELVSLSEQQLVDCDHECDPEGDPDDCDSGCDGGLMNNAFEYLLKSGGLMREDDYPYTAHDGYCKFDKTKIAAKVANFSVIPVDEDQIAANLVKYGPLALGINANYMSTYMGGVSCPLACSKELDHGVLLVGYGGGENLDAGEHEKPYWIIKNSWGSYWGEDGYYRICRGYSACGVDTLVSSVGAVDVKTQ